MNISIIDEEHRKFIDIVNKAIVAKQHNNNAEKYKCMVGTPTIRTEVLILMGEDKVAEHNDRLIP